MSSYENRSKADLMIRSKAVGIRGRSTMSKSQLINALRAYNKPNLTRNTNRRDELLYRLLDYMSSISVLNYTSAKFNDFFDYENFNSMSLFDRKLNATPQEVDAVLDLAKNMKYINGLKLTMSGKEKLNQFNSQRNI